jgi:hypothetical protein
MSTLSGNYVQDNSSLANFQSWTGAIFTAFTTFGWVQTSDTGQAANPIASVPSNAYVYWIFKANGTNAGSCPIYVKLSLGFSSTVPAVLLTVGTGSNGSGTITGSVLTNAPIGPSFANRGATVYTCYWSGNADNFRMYMWSNGGTSATGLVWVIDRSKNSSGVDTADYFTVMVIGTPTPINVNTATQQSIIVSPVSVSSQRDFACTTYNSNAANTGFLSGTVAAYPFFPDIGKVGNPLLGLMQVFYGDVADATSCSVLSMYGATHTYISAKDPSGGSCFSRYAAGNATGTAALLVQYE